MDCLVLDWVKTFLAVYRAGSVTAASRSLHLTQPTVSQHLKALESHLGRPLFDRLPRGVSPTPTGYELAASIGPHLDMIESLLESARAQPAGRWTGVVRLGGPADLIATAVVPSLAAALDDGIKLRIRLGLTDELIDGLRGRELDLVLATLQRRARGIEYEPIYKEEFVLVAGARWAARISRRSLQRQGATALADAPILAYAEHLPLLRRYWEKVFGTRLGQSARLVAPDLRALLGAAVAGAGVTVLPRYLAADALASGALRQLATPVEAPSNTIYLAYRPESLEHARVGLVRELLRRAASDW
jgi:DNA-binding transcriptional LysR family regulator